MDGFVHDLSPSSEVGGFSLDSEIPFQKSGILDKVHKVLGQELQDTLTRVQYKPAAPFVHPGTILKDRGDFLGVFSDSQAEDLRNRVANFDTSHPLNDFTAWLVRRGIPECYLGNALYPLMAHPSGVYSSAILTRSNLRIRGAGTGAELKLSDSFGPTYNAGVDYMMMGPASLLEFTQNFSVEDICFNANASATSGNLPTGGKVYNPTQIRSQVAISVYRGDRIKIQRCLFQNFGGRQIIRAGYLDNPPRIDRLKIEHNEFVNVGPGVGAYIDGSGNAVYLIPWQDDFSGIYAHGQRQYVNFNTFYNPLSINPQYTVDLNDGNGPTLFPMNCNAIEVHGQRTLCMGNKAVNFTSIINLVGQVHPHQDPHLIENEGYNLSKYGITFSSDPYLISRAVVSRNVLHMDATWDSGPVAGIYQGMRTSATSKALQDVTITENKVFSDVVDPKTQSWSGIDLCAVDGGKIKDNWVINVQAYGIFINHLGMDPTNPLPFRNVEITGNRLRDCGKQASASNTYAIRINFTDLNRIIENIDIDQNLISRTLDINYNASPNMKGISVDNGRIDGLRIGNLNRWHGIKRDDRYVFANVGAHQNVYVQRRYYSTLLNTTPISGYASVGLDEWASTDAARGGPTGRLCTVGGCFYKGQWAAGITVNVNETWRLSDGKKIKYLRGGQTGSVEPVLDPTKVWNSFADDGTAHGVLIDVADAVLTRGPMLPIPVSTTLTGFTLNPGEQTAVTTITVTGAALNMYVKAAISVDQNGVDIRAWVSATNTVKYFCVLPASAPAPVTLISSTMTLAVNS